MGVMNSRLMVSFMAIVDDLGGSHFQDSSCSFFAASIYGMCEGGVVSDLGGVDFGRFGPLRVWKGKGGRFGVEGATNSR